AAPQRRGRRGAADNVAVAPHRRDGTLETDLDGSSLARREAALGERAQTAEHLAGVEVQAYRHEAADGGGCVRQEHEAAEQAGCRREGFGLAELHAASERFERHAGQLERRALAGLRLLPRLAVHLN